MTKTLVKRSSAKTKATPGASALTGAKSSTAPRRSAAGAADAGRILVPRDRARIVKSLSHIEDEVLTIRDQMGGVGTAGARRAKNVR